MTEAELRAAFERGVEFATHDRPSGSGLREFPGTGEVMEPIEAEPGAVSQLVVRDVPQRVPAGTRPGQGAVTALGSLRKALEWALDSLDHPGDDRSLECRCADHQKARAALSGSSDPEAPR